jgi:hypothetical protein
MPRLLRRSFHKRIAPVVHRGVRRLNEILGVYILDSTISFNYMIAGSILFKKLSIQKW